MAEEREATENRAVVYGSRSTDEVSLRDLYLTFRAGLPIIVIVAVVCAAAAYIVVTARGSTYSTAATVSVTPPSVGNSALSGLELTVPTGIDFETYRAIAFDGDLLSRVVDAVDDGRAGRGVVDSEALRANRAKLLAGLRLRSLPPASQTRGHVTVEHVVTSGSAAGETIRAAGIANAWAAATAAAVAELMTAPIDAAIQSLTDDIAKRRIEFDLASAAWSEFLGVDERRSLNDRLDALTELDSLQRARVAELESAVTAANARLAALESALQLRVPDPHDSSRQLLDQRDTLLGEAAALQAELDHLEGVKAQALDAAVGLRSRLTSLEASAARLQRDLATASMTFYRVAPAVPTLQLQRELVVSSSRVAVPAAVPLLPEPRNRLLAVVAAAAIGGLFATLYYFLSAAVRAPDR